MPTPPDSENQHPPRALAGSFRPSEPAAHHDQWIRFVIRHSQEAMALVDSAGLVVEASTAFARSLGLDAGVQHHLVHLDWDDDGRFLLDLTTPELGRAATVRVCAPGSTDSSRWTVRVAGTLLGDAGSTMTVVSCEPATPIDRRSVLDFAASASVVDTDTLTGVASEERFRSHLSHVLEGPAEQRDAVCVLQLDLEHYSVLADDVGADRADELLVAFADRIKQQVRRHDLVARIGPDSFVVTYLAGEPDANDSTATAMAVAERIRRVASQPFQLGEELLFLGCAGGLAKAAPGTTVEQLLRRARVASQRSRETGARRVVRYHDHLRTSTLRRIALKRELQVAADDRQLRIVFQPTIDLRAGATVGVEALARWDHPRLGELTPDFFVPLAEEAGAIHELGAWVVENALAAASRWRDQELLGRDFTISVNISAHQLTAGFADRLEPMLTEWRLPADTLELEITESALMNQSTEARDTIETLRSRGVRLAIDDFGTGYSSLDYLRSYPVNSVKLDRMFVADVRPDGSGAPVAARLLDVARPLGISVAGEGVESVAQLEGLRTLGCDSAQGFYFTEPLSLVDMTAFLRAGHTW